MLYILIFLHQTATAILHLYSRKGCISLYSYIKPQPKWSAGAADGAVYPYIPTSNRNWKAEHPGQARLYILIFLHQTATSRRGGQKGVSCISLYSYIKPQHNRLLFTPAMRCISLYSYIKPQLNLWELLCTKGNTLYPRNKKRKRRSIFHCKVTKKVPIV